MIHIYLKREKNMIIVNNVTELERYRLAAAHDSLRSKLKTLLIFNLSILVNYFWE